MHKTQLALIGIGKWGKNYITAIEKSNKCRLVYLCAQTEASLAPYKNTYKITTHYQGLLKQTDIDGVIIATPGSTHVHIASYFIGRRIPLLIEKPLALTYRESKQLEKRVKTYKTMVMVGHIYLYNPAFLTLKRYLSDIKPLYYVAFEGYNFGPFRNDVSALWDWAPHDVAMSMELLEEKPRTVTAWGVNAVRPTQKLYDMIFIRLQFKNFDVFIKNGWLSPIRKRLITIVGKKGSLIFDDTAEHKVVYFPELIPLHDISRSAEPASVYLKYETVMPLQREIEEFVECIQKKREPKTDIHHAVDVAYILDAVEHSIEKNGKIMLLNWS